MGHKTRKSLLWDVGITGVGILQEWKQFLAFGAVEDAVTAMHPMAMDGMMPMDANRLDHWNGNRLWFGLDYIWYGGRFWDRIGNDNRLGRWFWNWLGCYVGSGSLDHGRRNGNGNFRVLNLRGRRNGNRTIELLQDKPDQRYRHNGD